jgi:hypothetical protein
MTLKNSVYYSVWDYVYSPARESVRISIERSARNSVYSPVYSSVWDYVDKSARESVRNSVCRAVLSSVDLSVDDLIKSYDT